MKATGIVRRIEECGIIGQNPVKIGFSIRKARCSLHIMVPDERYVHPAF